MPPFDVLAVFMAPDNLAGRVLEGVRFAALCLRVGDSDALARALLNLSALNDEIEAAEEAGLVGCIPAGQSGDPSMPVRPL